jgi:Fe-S cluster assembly protein SufD
VDHTAPHCTSRLYYKGILDGRSHAVFGGIVLVRPGAVKTDAEQADKNLLLSEEAEVDSKPSLEIYADDVKCGHGATAGTVADDAIFYMRSRGLDRRTAMSLLVKGFAGEIIESVRPTGLRSFLERLVSGILNHLDLERAA